MFSQPANDSEWWVPHERSIILPKFKQFHWFHKRFILLPYSRWVIAGKTSCVCLDQVGFRNIWGKCKHHFCCWIVWTCSCQSSKTATWYRSAETKVFIDENEECFLIFKIWNSAFGLKWLKDDVYETALCFMCMTVMENGANPSSDKIVNGTFNPILLWTTITWGKNSKSKTAARWNSDLVVQIWAPHWQPVNHKT